MSVVIVVGEDRFLAGEAVRDAVGGQEATRLRGGDTTLGAALDEARTPDFFGGGRCVVLEEADALLDGDGLDALAAFAEHPAPGSTLIIQAKKIDGRKAGAKKLKAASRWLAVQPPPEWKLAEWVTARARDAHGLTAERDAIEALVTRIGADLGALDGALVRLKEQIAPETRLRAGDVEISTEEHRSPALFEAGNAVEAGDAERALAAVEAAFREGLRMRADTVTESHGVALILLGQLHGAYRKLIRFHMARQGASDEEAARAAGISPKAARFFVDRARRHRLETLIDRHGAFVEADRELKRGGAEPQQVLERLLVSLFS
ncbi:MAG: DNA polymerase III subunit delta [Planctomycetota bacterium]